MAPANASPTPRRSRARGYRRSGLAPRGSAFATTAASCQPTRLTKTTTTDANSNEPQTAAPPGSQTRTDRTRTERPENAGSWLDLPRGLRDPDERAAQLTDRPLGGDERRAHLLSLASGLCDLGERELLAGPGPRATARRGTGWPESRGRPCTGRQRRALDLVVDDAGEQRAGIGPQPGLEVEVAEDTPLLSWVGFRTSSVGWGLTS